MSVKGVVTKVSLGEADAGIVYVTDVAAAGEKLDGIAIPDDQNALATYPLAALAASAAPGRREGLRRLRPLRRRARQVLTDHGFLPAP